MAPNGTNSKAETAAPGRQESHFERQWRSFTARYPRYRSASETRDPRIGHPRSWAISRDGTARSSPYTRGDAAVLSNRLARTEDRLQSAGSGLVNGGPGTWALRY